MAINPGVDFSGNRNNWTTNNISLTVSVNYDLMRDSPTNGSSTEDTGLGGQIPGNYATLNPLDKLFGIAVTGTTSEANLRSTAPVGDQGTSHSSIRFRSGKWYYEMTMVSLSSIPSAQYISYRDGANNAAFYAANGSVGGVSGSAGATYTTGDTVSLAVDKDAGTIQFYKNGVSQGGSRTLTNNVAGDSYLSVSNYNSSSVWVNFGQRPFGYAAPAGFKCLNTANLPQSAVPDGKDHFNALTYNGTAANQRVSGLDFKPDLAWFKERTTAGIPHALYDSLRNNYTGYLQTNDASAETGGNPFIEIDNTGYTLLGGVSTVNDAFSRRYVSWNWRAGDTTVTNTVGNITSQVRANPTAGFSIVSYTGNGSGALTGIGHGLTAAPKFYIIKNRGGATNWFVYHTSLGNTGLALNGSGPAFANDSYFSSHPSNNQIFVSTNSMVNTNGNGHIAYCWSEVEGYSKFGSYVGNGSADGPFVYTGFRPKFILVKSSTATNDWWMYDSSRDRQNTMNNLLRPNLTSADVTQGYPDFLSNGIKVRNTGQNDSGQTYIYAAFAEHPFKTSRAR